MRFSLGSTADGGGGGEDEDTGSVAVAKVRERMDRLKATVRHSGRGIARVYWIEVVDNIYINQQKMAYKLHCS